MELELISLPPRGPARPHPLLFVHGAWHAAWCWERFMPYLAARGYACHALSLRGHGGSAGRDGLLWHSARAYLADLEAAAAAMPAPPVLVGHSLGGYLVQRYLERRAAPGAALLAPLPAAGALGFLLRYVARHPLRALRALLAGDTGGLVGTPGLARDWLFSPELPAAELHRHAGRLQAESLRVILEVALRPPRPRPGAPMLVLAAAADRVFSLDEVGATARAWGAELAVLPGLAHNLMLDPGWERAAARLAAWLEAAGPQPAAMKNARSSW